jgi:uncharacterized membrane protein
MNLNYSAVPHSCICPEVNDKCDENNHYYLKGCMFSVTRLLESISTYLVIATLAAAISQYFDGDSTEEIKEVVQLIKTVFCNDT